MLNEFLLYAKLGLRHILDIKGYDHMLFVAVLLLSTQRNNWKGILQLITAFTIGHTVSLALSVLKIVNINQHIIETLIPVTILVSAIINSLQIKSKNNVPMYITILFFGLIHGLGFSGYLKRLLGAEDSIILPLVSFNLGLEAGQIVFIVIFSLALWILQLLARTQQKNVDLVINAQCILIAAWMIFAPYIS